MGEGESTAALFSKVIFACFSIQMNNKIFQLCVLNFTCSKSTIETIEKGPNMLKLKKVFGKEKQDKIKKNLITSLFDE